MLHKYSVVKGLMSRNSWYQC